MLQEQTAANDSDLVQQKFISQSYYISLQMQLIALVPVVFILGPRVTEKLLASKLSIYHRGKESGMNTLQLLLLTTC